MAKLIILSAPSGAGKSSIVSRLLAHTELKLQFSISATSRLPRGEEQHGKEYYFLTPDEFRNRIANNEFIEYEEVYTDKFYGTLQSEITRISEAGGNPIFDVDVEGGFNLKKIFGDNALSIFILPPSVDELRNRLVKRGTDTPDIIEERIQKAHIELNYAPQFDFQILNDDLDRASEEVYRTVKDFLGV